MEHQRQRAVPFPPLGQERREILVTDRVGRWSQVCELEEQLIAHITGHGGLGHGREQPLGLPHGREDERAAVFPGATPAPRATGERGAEEQRAQRGPGAQMAAVRPRSQHGA